jgi:large subunit ribosomal protein L38e
VVAQYHSGSIMGVTQDDGDNTIDVLLYLRGGDKIKSIAKSITIKTKKRKTKFKLRCPRYVYTLKVDDEKKAEKLKTSIPKEITKHEVGEKKGKKKAPQKQ